MDDNYSDAQDSTATATAQPEGTGDAKQEEGEQTGLLPKSFFGSKDLTPGKQCKVEIVKAYDDEIQVKYVAHKDSDSESPTEDATPGDKSEDMYSDE